MLTPEDLPIVPRDTRDTVLGAPQLLDSTSSHPHQGFPRPLLTPTPASVTAGRKSPRAAFCEVFLVFFFSQETLSQHSQTSGGRTPCIHTPGSAPRCRSAPIPCSDNP